MPFDVEGHEVFLKFLPPSADETQLTALFGSCGEILGDIRVLRDGNTGKCKGVAWITFATTAGQNAAMDLDGTNIGGRNVQVKKGNTTNWMGGHASTVGGVTGSVQAPGTHTPAMLKEVIASVVARDNNGIFVDGTFGRGGHTRGILAALGPRGSLHAFDLDPKAIEFGQQLAKEDSRFHIHHSGFGSMREVLKPLGVKPNGVFLDLGISSPQLDDAGRGFRPEQDGPLDLRFDLTSGQSAAEFLETAPRPELIRVLQLYGDPSDPYAARRVADAVCLAREKGSCPKTTKAFGKLVQSCRGYEYQAMHPAKTVFQALRIHMNDEFGQLRDGMAAARKIMVPGGRLGILTWKHSECAAVVEFLRTCEVATVDFPLLRWYKSVEDTLDEEVQQGWGMEAAAAQRPQSEELKLNSRSRSAVLHVFYKKQGFRCADLEGVAEVAFGWSGAAPAGDEDSAPAPKKGKRAKKVDAVEAEESTKRARVK